MLENSIFFILALFLIIGAIGTISFKQSVFSAISFLLAMVALGGLFALLNQSFLFLAQILVAVGAVVTLSLLVIVSVNVSDKNLPKEDGLSFWQIFLASLLILPILRLIYKAISSQNFIFSKVSDDFGSLSFVGKFLFSDWVLPFEIVSILLLSAMIGGIVISTRKLK